MLTSSDFKELLNLFEKYNVRYLIVWIAADPENASAVYAALKAFGAPLANLTADDFTHRGYFYQMGRPPLRVDIMMSIPGIEFEEAWKNREVIELDYLKIPFISRSDLIKAKKASGRPQDKIDVEKLLEAEELESTHGE